jgi:hypothetical protein
MLVFNEAARVVESISVQQVANAIDESFVKNADLCSPEVSTGGRPFY